MNLPISNEGKTLSRFDCKIVLRPDDYLCKIYKSSSAYVKHPIGFLTKLNKDNSIPKAFWEWNCYTSDRPDNFTIHTETYRIGWKFIGFRFGTSQNWVTVLHPLGFTLEIYLEGSHLNNGATDFNNIIRLYTMNAGTIYGSFKWAGGYLYQKP